MRLASNAPVTGRRLLHSILAFVIGIAWALTSCTPALASTSATTTVAQTEPPPGQQPAPPDSGFSGELFPDPNEGPSSARADSSAVPPDSVSTAPPDSAAAARADSAAAAQPDSAAAAQPDSAAAGATFKPKSSALPDTLEFLPAPGSQTAAKPGDAPAAPKQRTGILGIHPIAILVGIAALHYFITKVVAD